MATRLGGVSKVLLMVFVFALGVGSTLFVIRLPDILPESAATAPAFLDAPPVVVESEPEPMISLVRNDAVPSTATESANWDVVVFPPIATTEEAAASRADAVAKTPDLFVPTENSLSATVPDVAPPDAFAEHSEPLAQRPSSTDFGTPASEGALPLEPPPANATTAPPLEPFTPASRFASTEPETRPAGNDPFSAPPGIELPQPVLAGDAPPLAMGGTAAPAPPPKALVLVELTANADGSVKQLRYLTEELGSDDAAFQKLEKQIVAWAGQYTGGDLTVQIVAEPQLRFEHVSRVMNLCSPLVTRVVLAKAETTARVTITVGFVRDGQGNRINATPVLFLEDEVLPVYKLYERFQAWNFDHAARPFPRLDECTILIRVDRDVNSQLVEEIIRQARSAGFEQFTLKEIDVAATAIGPVRGTVLAVDNESQTVHVSKDADDAFRVGEALDVERLSAERDKSGPVIARAEVTRIQPAVVECRIIEEDLFTPIKVGDVVRTAGRQAVPVAKPGPAAF